MPSSFRYHVAESVSVWPQAREADPRLTMYHDKLVLREHLLAQDVPVPAVLDTVGPLDRLTPEHLAAPVVLKATRGHSGLAVRALEPNGDGTWLEWVSGRTVGFDDITTGLRRLVDETGLEDRWFLEELLPHVSLPHRVADDLKVYAFQGETPLILQRRAGRPVRYRWYDSSWTPVQTGKYVVDPALEPPPVPQREEVLQIAQQLSSAAPRPFVRVDVLVSSAGLRVGELTPHPGGFQHFDEDWDQRLGREWALARLRMDSRATEALAGRGRLATLEGSRSRRLTAPLRRGWRGPSKLPSGG